jgi:hypothetical protein
MRKNVAFALYLSRSASSAGVTAGFGPSSNVSAIVDKSPVWRIVLPKSCDDGATAAHENIPAAAHTPAATDNSGIIPIAEIFARATALC